MIRESEIRQKLLALFGDQLSLTNFERWLGPASRNMHLDSAPEAMRMVSDIHHIFAAYDRSYIDDSQLRRELLLFINNVSESVVIGNAVVMPAPIVSASRPLWVLDRLALPA